MSLDVYLVSDKKIPRPITSGIFIRENGATIEISEEEWRKRNPTREPVRFQNKEEETNIIFSANITHNLGKMANEAGIYLALWRPEELGITKAKDLIPLLQKGLRKLGGRPHHYQSFNPENGWGDFHGLVDFVKSYLNACREYPEALIEVSR